MFILFAGKLFNVNTVIEIARSTSKDNNAEKPFQIELIRNMQPPILESFATPELMNKRFQSLKESVGCGADR